MKKFLSFLLITLVYSFSSIIPFINKLSATSLYLSSLSPNIPCILSWINFTTLWNLSFQYSNESFNSFIFDFKDDISLSLLSNSYLKSLISSFCALTLFLKSSIDLWFSSKSSFILSTDKE